MKILLADDHALFRAGAVHVLRQLDTHVEIIETGNCEETLAAVNANPDLSLILLDLYMPDGDGLNTLDAVRLRHAGIPIVVLSGSEKHHVMQSALKKGAVGFIPKTVTPAVMLSALQLVLAGGVYIPPQMFKEIEATTNGAGETSLDLTPRQLEVLARAIEGKPYKVISRELGLAESTIKTHLLAAFRALGVSNRMQAARKVQELKLKLPRT
jgi:DNA-binding NarL/FixJ family response regulator